MEIQVAKTAGFCFGVRRALQMTEEERQKSPDVPIYTLGPLIHNRDVIRRLESEGIHVAEDPGDLSAGDTVVIRAHGVPRVTEEALKEKGVRVVDATCPFVKKIHRIVEEASADGHRILILGDPRHPEVIGIRGWSHSECAVAQNAADPGLQGFFEADYDGKSVCVVEQTTFNQENFQKTVEYLKEKEYNISVYPTICSATAEHQSEAIQLSSRSDMMIVVGGDHSSNTRKLFEICGEHCSIVCLVENASELRAYLQGNGDIIDALRTGRIQRVGITAGASTPNYILQEVVKSMSEMNVFEEMLNESFKEVHSGDIVKGTVVSVTDNEVVLNIGYKADAMMIKDEYSADPSTDLKNEVKVGDEIEVVVAKVGDSDVLVSRKRLLQNRAYQELENAYTNKTVLTGTVTETFENGAVVTYKNNRVFIPASLLDIRKVDPKTLEGKEVNFRIIRLQRRRGRILGDRRTVMFEERNARRDATIAKLEPGARLTGTVKNLTVYCAFIDLGGIDGMLHISEMSWTPVRNPNQVLKVGQQVNVMVKSFDPETRKISLTAKLPETNPWNNAEEWLYPGAVLVGKVVRFTDFGAFVELKKDVDGLVHISQIADHFIKHPSEVLVIGQDVYVRVLDVNYETKRISLSMRNIAIADDDYEEEGAPVEEAPVEEAPVEEAAPAEEAPVEEA
ncbi:MAG: bifunctional 4-hydroxy-3-methylbut-2-enyl diphosphate reductase/30S ribosomal protein S1 [Firmicutes bacterium]|nr:bifunctional 4-hydroxy-3-methylbut-2-enyl diphosphate reductase/30S ribosomal protein S1 [Bacillota bacterium]